MKRKSLLRQILEAYIEQARYRKALRMLSRQVWSVEFLSYLLTKAGKALNDNVTLVIEDKDKRKLYLTYDNAVANANAAGLNDDIFNHLDDSVAVDAFIRANSTRR